MNRKNNQPFRINLIATVTLIILSSGLSAQGDNCGNAIDLCSITSPYSGTTTGKANDFTTFCSMSTSEDMIFYIDIPANVTLTIGQSSNSYDSRHTLRYGGSCPGSNEIKCTDDPDTETITWTNSTGTMQRVYWVQAGYSSNDGAFNLAWSAPGACVSTCDDPSNLSATNFTGESADLSWLENGSATVWDIEYGSIGFSPTGIPDVNDVSANPYTLIGLSPNTSYSYYVRSECGTLQSNWVGPFTFSTISCNLQLPSGFAASNVTSSTVDLTWTENGNAVSWDISVGAPGYTPSSPTLSGSTSNSITYAGLSISTSYDLYVRANCGGSFTTWVGPISITTLDIPTNYTSELLDGWAKGVIQADDNNYIFTGYANADVQIVKTQQGGDLIWAKTFGGAGTDYGYALVNSGDGGFVNLAKSNTAGLNPNGNYDLLISKIDTDGNHVWSRSIGTSSSDQSDNGTIIRNADNSFSFVSSGSYLADLVFGHIAADGSTIALKELSLRTGAQGFGITQTQDGGWVVCGSYTFSGYEFFVVKISSTYTLQWSMVWGDGTGNQEKIYSIIENAANDYTVFGSTFGLGTTPQNMYAARFTNNGSGPTVVWQKTYGDNNSCFFTHAIRSSDGNYVVTGSSGAYDYISEWQDSYLAKINSSNGSIIWQTFKNDDGVSNRIGECVIEDNQGNFVVAGLGGYDMLKFDYNGAICDGGIGSLVEENLGNSFPNLINNTEGSSFNWFGAGNSSVNPVFSSFGLFVPGCNVTPIVLGAGTYSLELNCDGEEKYASWKHFYKSGDKNFAVEGSIDGINYFLLDNIDILENEQVFNYRYSIKVPGVNYIRLRVYDINGQAVEVGFISVVCDINEDYVVFPNPSNKDFTLVTKGSNQERQLFVYSSLGQIIKQIEIPRHVEQLQLGAQEWSEGLYLIEIRENQDTNPSFKTKLIKVN